MDKQDKELDVGIKADGFEGSLKFKNYHSRVLASLGDILIDKLNYCRWNNALKFLDKYDELKSKRNIAGKETPLPPKYLFEILENAFVEDDHTIQELWAKLLVNWQDPKAKFDMRPVYLTIIKSLTPTEAGILKVISEDISKIGDSSSYSFDFETDDYDFSNIGYFISRKRIIDELGISESDYTLSMLNLFRCMCMESVKTPFTRLNIASQTPVVKDHGLILVKPTTLGINLINQCVI